MIVGAETDVAPFEDGHHDAAFPQSANRAPGEDEIEEFYQDALQSPTQLRRTEWAVKQAHFL